MSTIASGTIALKQRDTEFIKPLKYVVHFACTFEADYKVKLTDVCPKYIVQDVMVPPFLAASRDYT